MKVNFFSCSVVIREGLKPLLNVSVYLLTDDKEDHYLCMDGLEIGTFLFRTFEGWKVTSSV